MCRPPGCERTKNRIGKGTKQLVETSGQYRIFNSPTANRYLAAIVVAQPIVVPLA